jgi:hypothetical protein
MCGMQMHFQRYMTFRWPLKPFHIILLKGRQI